MIEFQNGAITFLSLITKGQDKQHAISVQLHGQVGTLSVQEGLDLLDWLYQHRDELYELRNVLTNEQIQAMLAQPPLDDSGLDELTF